jgi:hypothetical protein
MPMLVPATELDRVYSDPAATETTWEETRKVLETAELFWDGRWQFTARDGAFRDLDGNGEAMVFAVTPVKVWAHAQGDPFGHTRHRFPGRAGLDGGSQ